MAKHYRSKKGKKMQEDVAKKFPIANKATVHKYSGEVSWKGKAPKSKHMSYH